MLAAPIFSLQVYLSLVNYPKCLPVCAWLLRNTFFYFAETQILIFGHTLVFWLIFCSFLYGCSFLAGGTVAVYTHPAHFHQFSRYSRYCNGNVTNLSDALCIATELVLSDSYRIIASALDNISPCNQASKRLLSSSYSLIIIDCKRGTDLLQVSSPIAIDCKFIYVLIKGGKKPIGKDWGSLLYYKNKGPHIHKIIINNLQSHQWNIVPPCVAVGLNINSICMVKLKTTAMNHISEPIRISSVCLKIVSIAPVPCNLTSNWVTFSCGQKMIKDNVTVSSQELSAIARDCGKSIAWLLKGGVDAKLIERQLGSLLCVGDKRLNIHTITCSFRSHRIQNNSRETTTRMILPIRIFLGHMQDALHLDFLFAFIIVST